MKIEKERRIIEKIVYVFLIALPLLGGGNYFFNLSPLWGNAILFLTIPICLLFIIFLSPKNHKWMFLRWSDGLLAAFTIITVLSYFYSRSRSDSLMALLLFLGSISLALLVRLSASDIHSIERMAKMILFSSLGVIAYEFYQSFWQFGAIAKTISLETGKKELIEHFQMYRTPFSTFMTSNNLACYLVMIVPLCFYFLTLERRNTGGYRWTFLLGLISLALFMTASKGGILTYFILTLLMLISMYRFDREGFYPFLKRVSFSVMAALVLTAILWNVAWKPEGQNSFKNEVSTFMVTSDKIESSATGRIHYWETAYHIWKDHWVVGSGIGTYAVLNSKYQENVYYSKHAHNDYLEILAESGIVGLLFFIASIAALFILAIRAFQVINLKRGASLLAEDRFHKNLFGACLVLSLSGFLIHSFIDFNWEIPANRTLFLILLMMLASVISILISGSPEENKNVIKVEAENRVGKMLVFSLLIVQWLWIPKVTIAQSYFELAADHLEQNRLKSISFAEEASALFPSHYRYHLFLAKAYKENGLSTSTPEDLDKALIEGETAVSLQPEIAENHGEFAAILYLKGDHLNAEKEGKLAIKMGKKQLKFYNQLGEFYLDQKDYKNALVVLEQGLSLANDYMEAHQSEMKKEALKTHWLLSRLDEIKIRGENGNY
jgi:O-antigen ligase